MIKESLFAAEERETKLNKLSNVLQILEEHVDLAREIDGAKAYACDAADAVSVDAAFAAIRAELGEIDTLIFNPGTGIWKSVEEITPEEFEQSWRVNALGALLVHSPHEEKKAWKHHFHRGDGIAPRRSQNSRIRFGKSRAEKPGRIDGPPSWP